MSMGVKGSLDHVFLTLVTDTLSLLTFSSQFLYTVMSCRIFFPAFAPPVPVVFIASPSHFQWCWRPLKLTLTHPHAPLLYLCTNICLAWFYPHSPKGVTTCSKNSSCGCVGCLVGRGVGAAAGWEHRQCPQPLLLWIATFPCNLVRKGLAPRRHIPHLI